MKKYHHQRSAKYQPIADTNAARIGGQHHVPPVEEEDEIDDKEFYYEDEEELYYHHQGAASDNKKHLPMVGSSDFGKADDEADSDGDDIGAENQYQMRESAFASGVGIHGQPTHLQQRQMMTLQPGAGGKQSRSARTGAPYGFREQPGFQQAHMQTVQQPQECGDCAIAGQLLQERDKEILALRKKLKKYDDELRRQKFESEVLNAKNQQNQNIINDQNEKIMQLDLQMMHMARQMHKLKAQAKAQQKQKLGQKERPQTQLASSSGEGTIQQAANQLRVQTEGMSMFASHQTGRNEINKGCSLDGAKHSLPPQTSKEQSSHEAIADMFNRRHASVSKSQQAGQILALVLKEQTKKSSCRRPKVDDESEGNAYSVGYELSNKAQRANAERVQTQLDRCKSGRDRAAEEPAAADDEEGNQRMDTGEYDEVVDLPRQIYQSNNQTTSSHSKGVIFHVNSQAKDSVPRGADRQNHQTSAHSRQSSRSNMPQKHVKEQLESSIYYEYRVCQDNGEALSTNAKQTPSKQIVNQPPEAKAIGQSKFPHSNQTQVLSKSSHSQRALMNIGNSDQVGSKTAHPNFFEKDTKSVFHNNLSEGPTSNFSIIRKMAAQQRNEQSAKDLEPSHYQLLAPESTRLENSSLREDEIPPNQHRQLQEQKEKAQLPFEDSYQMMSGGAVNQNLYNAHRSNQEMDNMISQMPAVKGTHFEDQLARMQRLQQSFDNQSSLKKDCLTDHKVLSTISYDFSNNNNQEAKLFFGNASDVKEAKSTRNMTPLDRSVDGFNLRTKDGEEADKKSQDTRKTGNQRRDQSRNLDMPLQMVQSSQKSQKTNSNQDRSFQENSGKNQMSEEIQESHKRPNKPANFSEQQTLAGRRDSLAAMYPAENTANFDYKNLNLSKFDENQSEQSPNTKFVQEESPDSGFVILRKSAFENQPQSVPAEMAQTTRLDTEHLQSRNISEILAQQNAASKMPMGQMSKSNELIQDAQKRKSELSIDLGKVHGHLEEVPELPRQEASQPSDPANITQESMPQTCKSNLTISFQETANQIIHKSTARNKRAKASYSRRHLEDLVDSVMRRPKGSRTLKDNRRQLSSQHRIRHNNWHLEDSAIGPLHRRGERDLEESKDDPLTTDRESRGIGRIAGDQTNERLYFNRKSNQYFEDHQLGVLNQISEHMSRQESDALTTGSAVHSHPAAPLAMRVNDSTVFHHVEESVDRSTLRDPCSEVRNEHSTIGRTSRQMYGAGETDRDLMLDTDEQVQDPSQRLPSNRIIEYQLHQRTQGGLSQMPGPSHNMRSISQRNTQPEPRVLPKSVELVAHNKFFLKNLTGSVKNTFDDRHDEQKISLDLGKLRMNSNQSQIFRTSNKTVSRQMQQSPTPKLMNDFNPERTLKSILSEHSNSSMQEMRDPSSGKKTDKKGVSMKKTSSSKQIIVSNRLIAPTMKSNIYQRNSQVTKMSRMPSIGAPGSSMMGKTQKVQTSMMTHSEQKRKDLRSSRNYSKKSPFNQFATIGNDTAHEPASYTVNLQKSDDSRQSIGSSNKALQSSSLLLASSGLGAQVQKRKKLSLQITDNFQQQGHDNQSFSRAQMAGKNMMTIQTESRKQNLIGGRDSNPSGGLFQAANRKSQVILKSTFSTSPVLGHANSRLDGGLSQSARSSAVNLLDDFMVIGLDADKVRNENELIEGQLNKIQTKEQYKKVFDFNQPENAEDFWDDRIQLFESQEPESLWSFTENKEDIQKCPRRRVVRNFCFPEGVKVSSVVSMQQVQSALLNQFGFSSKQGRSSDVSERSVHGVLQQIRPPFTFIFNLNKKEEPKPKKRKKVLQKKKSPIEQDMVMPGLPQVPQNNNYRPSSRAGRDTVNTQPSNRSGAQSSQQPQNHADSANEEEWEYEDEELGSAATVQLYNPDSLMYCLCFRFNSLLLKPSLLAERSEAAMNFFDKSKKFTKVDLQKMIESESVFLSQRAFCVLFSTNCFFGLHGDFLMKVYQAFALQIQDKLRHGDYGCLFSDHQTMCDSIKPIIQEMHCYLMPNLLNKEVVINLQAYKKSVLQMLKGRNRIREQLGQNSRQIERLSQMVFDVAESGSQIVYQANEPFFDCIFGLLSPTEIVNLIKAILLEKSIVFIGPEHLLAMFIFGFNKLIAPFLWCFSIIPIIPVSLLDILDAPVPLIVGITTNEYQILLREGILEQEQDQKIWVHLELAETEAKGASLVGAKCPAFQPPKIENLREQLDLNALDANHLISSMGSCRFFDLHGRVERALSTQQKVQEIEQVVKGLVNDQIVAKMKEKVDFLDGDTKNVLNHCDWLVQEHHHTVDTTRPQGQPCIYSLGDRQFVKEFTKTQIFASFIDKFIDQAKAQS